MHEARWKGLVKIFKPTLWYATAIVFLVSWIFWIVLGKFSNESSQHKNHNITFFNVLAINLGISIHNRPILSPLRILFVILAVYSMTLFSLYTSKLITVFTNPKLAYQIDSIEEILQSDIKIGGRSENMDWFNNGDETDMKIFERYNSSEAFR